MPDKRVFVVDDDAAVRQGLRFMLRAAGYCVEALPSARSFLEDTTRDVAAACCSIYGCRR
jgi:FixJ family two-component response regulator